MTDQIPHPTIADSIPIRDAVLWLERNQGGSGEFGSSRGSRQSCFVVYKAKSTGEGGTKGARLPNPRELHNESRVTNS